MLTHGMTYTTQICSGSRPFFLKYDGNIERLITFTLSL